MRTRSTERGGVRALARRTAGAALLVLGGMLLAGDVSAQELPQPITRPCVHPCLNKIQFAKDPRLDKLTLHGRIIPLSSIDPAFEAFTLELTNANGTVFSATLNPGDLKEAAGGRRAIYRNPSARLTGGLFRVQIAQRNDPAGGYRVDIVAYGDMSSATLPEMTVFLLVGDDAFFTSDPWIERRNGWVVDFLP